MRFRARRTATDRPRGPGRGPPEAKAGAGRTVADRTPPTPRGAADPPCRPDRGDPDLTAWGASTEGEAASPPGAHRTSEGRASRHTYRPPRRPRGPPHDIILFCTGGGPAFRVSSFFSFLKSAGWSVRARASSTPAPTGDPAPGPAERRRVLSRDPWICGDFVLRRHHHQSPPLSHRGETAAWAAPGEPVRGRGFAYGECLTNLADDGLTLSSS